MPLSLVLDILIAVLLVLTIGYAVVLNRRLAGLRKNKEELEALFATFGETTNKADAGVRRLKATAAEIDAAMTGGMDEARSLREDLAFLIERGTELADRLEAGIRGARVDGPTVPVTRPKPKNPIETNEGLANKNDEMPEPRSEAERELLKALRAVR